MSKETTIRCNACGKQATGTGYSTLLGAAHHARGKAKPMTDAEQFLADLESKAKAATPGPWQPGEIMEIGTVRQANGWILADCRLQFDDGLENSRFIAAANPAAVLRLVSMVRWLAEGCDCNTKASSYGSGRPDWRLKMAYIATENHHD